MKIQTILLLIIAVYLTGCASFHHRQASNCLSSTETVELFIDVYGTSEISDVAPHLTASFREDLPREKWVIDAWQGLKNIEYKRISGKIIQEKTEGDTAAILVESRISTAAGENTQRELFLLIKDNKKGWLIDKLEVGDEQITIDNLKEAV